MRTSSIALLAVTIGAVCACSHSLTATDLRPVRASQAPMSAINPLIRYLGLAAAPGNIARFAAATGAVPDMIAEYLQPEDRFNPPPTGEMPLVSLATTQSPVEILAGAADADLTALGHELAIYGKPIAVSVDPEGNGPWYSYGTHRATHGQYVAIYRHIHDVIERSRARNVIWVWTISNSPPITHQSLLRQLYPGDAYVDWIGIDGYFIGAENSFNQVFTRVFIEVRTFTRRSFLITETSVKPGRRAAEWVRDLFAGVETCPNVVGFVWFDYDKAAQFRDDWRLEDDPSALAAFRSEAKEYFRQKTMESFPC